MISTKAVVGGAVAAVLLLLALIAIASAFYSVDESEYILELRFGEVKNVRTEPGLYVKAPFIDSVQRIDKRTLRADIPPREVPDRDKERLIIDMIVRYQITDPVEFRKALRNEATAHERLQAITYSAMRDTVGQHDRIDIIGAQAMLDEDGSPVSDEEGLPIYQSLVGTRDKISKEIQARIEEAVVSQNYGIHIISADIKRADFPSQVRSSIIDRLWAERQRVAARHRADGEEEYRKRTARVQAEADILLAEASRDARQTRGDGEAEAIGIVQEALTRDPQFYRFLRSLESYERSIQQGATLVISGETGGYLDTLTGGPPSRRAGNGQETASKLKPPPLPPEMEASETDLKPPPPLPLGPEPDSPRDEEEEN